MNKTKIVLDADVIIHFSKAKMLSVLPKIFPLYKYIILDKVYEELKGEVKFHLDNQIQFFNNITHIEFNPSGLQMKEYAYLISKKFGKGESASMIFCKWNHDVLASSNLRDIEEFCREHQITYLTTFDFLYYGVKNKIITNEEAYDFINQVRNNNSKLLSVDKFKEYVSKVII